MRRSLIAGLIIGIVLAGGMAFASVPDASGVIHACLRSRGNPAAGYTVRIVDTQRGKCDSDELSLNWNQQGRPGESGRPGAQGPSGATGPAGPAALRWQGEWREGRSYSIGDAVEWDGTSFVSVQDGNRDVPGSTSSWGLLAARGSRGDFGPSGPAGATGATGPQGPAGPIGPTGPAGGLPRASWVTSGLNIPVTGTADAPTPITLLRLRAGSYLVTARVNYQLNDVVDTNNIEHGAELLCKLSLSNGAEDPGTERLTGNAPGPLVARRVGSMVLQMASTFNGAGTAAVRCSLGDTQAFGRVTFARISAIEVASIDVQHPEDGPQ
jgi:hypothetical protein